MKNQKFLIVLLLSYLFMAGISFYITNKISTVMILKSAKEIQKIPKQLNKNRINFFSRLFKHMQIKKSIYYFSIFGFLIILITLTGGLTSEEKKV